MKEKVLTSKGIKLKLLANLGEVKFQGIIIEDVSIIHKLKYELGWRTICSNFT